MVRTYVINSDPKGKVEVYEGFITQWSHSACTERVLESNGYGVKE
jgi:hypothetical protein